MTNPYKEAKPFNEVASSESLEFISKLFKPRVARVAIESHIIEMVGPLNARERWDLLIQARFPDFVRSRIFTGAEPWQLAYNLFETATNFGYPANLYLLQLVGVENLEWENIDQARTQEAMQNLLKPE